MIYIDDVKHVSTITTSIINNINHSNKSDKATINQTSIILQQQQQQQHSNLTDIQPFLNQPNQFCYSQQQKSYHSNQRHQSHSIKIQQQHQQQQQLSSSSSISSSSSKFANLAPNKSAYSLSSPSSSSLLPSTSIINRSRVFDIEKEYYGINQIPPYIDPNFSIKARCIKKGEVRTFNKRDGSKSKLFSFEMMDASRLIRCTVWGEEADRWFPFLKLNDVYVVQKGKVQLPYNLKLLSQLYNKYMIVIIKCLYRSIKFIFNDFNFNR